ncbi:hypothetical protein BH11CYA1_BH11CYA1_46880 [soil metagenome]
MDENFEPPKEFSISDLSDESQLVLWSTGILLEQIPFLEGCCKLYYLTKELEINEQEPYDFLWALADDCSELYMSDSDKFNRHPDLIARKAQEAVETAASYREKGIKACEESLKRFGGACLLELCHTPSINLASVWSQLFSYD